MSISGPEQYTLTYEAEKFAVESLSGAKNFSGFATSKLPKLYIASREGVPIYVGLTVQSMSSRLRSGAKAAGKGGYYGYAWRHDIPRVDLDIWWHENAPVENRALDMETVEAEVVYLIRSNGQWPKYQTEIHFHQSEPQHRAAAAAIAVRYGIGPRRRGG